MGGLLLTGCGLTIRTSEVDFLTKHLPPLVYKSPPSFDRCSPGGANDLGVHESRRLDLLLRLIAEFRRREAITGLTAVYSPLASSRPATSVSLRLIVKDAASGKTTIARISLP